MRATLDIADDVLQEVEERAQRESRSAGEVISDLARQALGRARGAREKDVVESLYGFEPLPHRGPAVSNELVDELREEEGI